MIRYVYLDFTLSILFKICTMIKSCSNVVFKSKLLTTSKLSVGSMFSQSKISRPVSQYIHVLERKDKVAVVDQLGTHTYGDLSNHSNVVANNVNRFLGSKNDGPKKISFLCDNDSSYINTLFGIWRAGHVAVPLCKTHPSQNLEYYVKDSESVAVIASKTQINKVIPFTENLKTCELLSYEEIIEATESYPSIDVSHVSVYFQF